MKPETQTDRNINEGSSLISDSDQSLFTYLTTASATSSIRIVLYVVCEFVVLFCIKMDIDHYYNLIKDKEYI